MFRTYILLFVVVLPVFSCGGSSGSADDRGFSMGFTPWPYDATTAAVDFVYDSIANNGDLIAHHIDAGVPWQEALDSSPYPAAVEAELARRILGTPSDKEVYLALSPLNSARDDLAGYWDDTGTQQTLTGPWQTRDLDSVEVIAAYTNFSLDLIDRFAPDYFNLGIEVSELAINDLVRYQRYITFISQVSANIRAQHPDLPLMISVGLKTPGSAAAATIESQIPAAVQFVDVVGISVYPYIFFDHADKGDPANLPSDWLSQINTVAAGKPVAIAETGWVAESLVIPAFSVNVPADQDDQDGYMRELLLEAEAIDARFIVWFFHVDYDALWNGALAQSPLAHVWRDTGLFDENLNPRPALARWQDSLALSRRQD